MTRAFTQSDMDEINAFAAEFKDLGLSLDDLDADDDVASVDKLISQLEAATRTNETLIQAQSISTSDLRDEVHELANRIAKIAEDLASINARLQ